jgi:hypothetical protein
MVRTAANSSGVVTAGPYTPEKECSETGPTNPPPTLRPVVRDVSAVAVAEVDGSDLSPTRTVLPSSSVSSTLTRPSALRKVPAEPLTGAAVAAGAAAVVAADRDGDDGGGAIGGPRMRRTV